jgi:hypothetical protein
MCWFQPSRRYCQLAVTTLDSEYEHAAPHDRRTPLAAPQPPRGWPPATGCLPIHATVLPGATLHPQNKVDVNRSMNHSLLRSVCSTVRAGRAGIQVGPSCSFRSVLVLSGKLQRAAGRLFRCDGGVAVYTRMRSSTVFQ